MNRREKTEIPGVGRNFDGIPGMEAKITGKFQGKNGKFQGGDESFDGIPGGYSF